MSRTPTLPPTDKGMWRKLIARAHPDTGGDHELFIWSRAAMEAICGGLQTERPQWASRQRDKSSATEPDRVPFERGANFADLTRRALELADEVEAPYSRILRMLGDCRPSPAHETQERRGASYKMLAAIGHKAGMDKRERVRWYRIAETVPLSDRHAGHILSRLKREAA